jgi:hypothetical protein
MEKIGVVNLIPVGSIVLKSIRKDKLKLDVLLNYTNLKQDFKTLIEQIKDLLEKHLITDFLSSQNNVYKVDHSISEKSA